MKRLIRAVLPGALLAFVMGMAGSMQAQQVVDTNFNVSVSKPAYTDKHPRILFDDGHFNVHTSQGSYQPFVTLMKNDGYAVTANTNRFDARTLAGHDVLVIVNARAMAQRSDKPAFTDAECDAVKEWVEQGGALLLVADHYPTGNAAENLSKRFKVDMSKGTTSDAANVALNAGGPSTLQFTREKGLIGDHPITRGRDEKERINKVITFTGQSLKGPEGSVAFLKLSETAVDRMQPAEGAAPAVRQQGPGANPGPGAAKGGRPRGAAMGGPQVSAAGRAQGVALKFGKGRVVVLGEASQLSAQRAGPQARPMGMNHPDVDNRQMALNIMHWLTGLLDKE